MHKWILKRAVFQGYVVLGLMGFGSPAMAFEFTDEAEWNAKKAEILEYQVKKIYLGKELKFTAFQITEGMHYFPNGEIKRASGKGSKPVINMNFNYSFKRDRYEKYIQADLLFLRKKGAPLIKEKASVLGWENPFNRELSAEGGVQQLTISSRNEPSVKVSIRQSPVYTPEQLFLHLRTVPLEKMGYREKIWLMGSLCEDVLDRKIQFAEITVVEPRVLFDKQTVYVTVAREDGKSFEFYLNRKGLHQVVYALYPDKTTFQLEQISLERYWFFDP